MPSQVSRGGDFPLERSAWSPCTGDDRMDTSAPHRIPWCGKIKILCTVRAHSNTVQRDRHGIREMRIAVSDLCQLFFLVRAKRCMFGVCVTAERLSESAFVAALLQSQQESGYKTSFNQSHGNRIHKISA